MKKILLIDDDPQVRNVIRVMLSKQGFQVIESGDGKAAIRLLKTAPVDLVITDILMPGKDGLDTIEELRALRPGLIIMAISGGGRYLDSTCCLDSAKMVGADAILNKPVAMQRLLQTINDLFEAEIVVETV
ncbi:response regulator [Desulfosarcina sp.]|uniref:response regulator n=1 Tax=Desulfosarcina sp. TaxID=2027861 RepID=UPI003970A420